MTSSQPDQTKWSGGGRSGSPKKTVKVSLIHNLPAGAFIVDREGVIADVNQLALDYLGAAREEVLDQSYQRLFQAAIKQAVDPQRAEEKLRIGVNNLRREPLIALELVGQRRSFYEIRLFPLDKDDSKRGRWGGLVIDRTSEQQLDEEREQEVYFLSRQIRKELASLSGNVQAVVGNQQIWDGVLVAEFLDEIEFKVGEISLLLDQQLDLMAINQDKLTVYPRAYSLEDIIDQTLSRILSKERFSEIEVLMPADLPTVRIDPDQMDHVLGYLIHQAAAKSQVNQGIQINARPEGNWVQVSISGSKLSPGMDQRKGQNSTENNQTGLAISKKIIRAQGGDLWVEEPEIDKGNRQYKIIFRIPILPLQRDIQMQKSRREGEQGHQGRILIADHEPADQELLKRVFEKEGYRVDLAVNGIAAIDMVQTNSPNLVILEWLIPELGGGSLVRSIRQWSPVPVLVITSKTSPQELLTAFKLGVDDYLTKPYLIDEVLARSEALLRRASRIDQFAEGEIFEEGGLRIDFKGRRVWKKGRNVDLTPIEYTLLSILVRHRKQVLSYSQLMEMAWEGPDQGTRQGLFVHISRLRDKIEEDSENPHLIKTRRGMGYVFLPD